MLRVAAYCLIMLFAASSAGQDLIKCDDGRSLWVISNENSIFAISLSGDVSQGNVPEIINVEDKALHYILLDRSVYISEEGDNNDEMLLKRFATSEEEALSVSKMQVVYDFLKLPSGQDYLLWHHDWFDATGDVEQQVHATIIINETVVWLSCPKFMWQDLGNIETFLTEAIANVNVVDSVDDLCGK